MQMSPKTVNYGRKPRFRQRTVFAKNLGFGVGFGYRNNTTAHYISHMHYMGLCTRGCTQSGEFFARGNSGFQAIIVADSSCWIINWCSSRFSHGNCLSGLKY